MHSSLAILCYHRVLPEAEREGLGASYFVRGTAVTERTFAAQVRALAETFDVLDEGGALAWLRAPTPSPRPRCWITFDDGYRDVAQHAWPHLTRYGLPATVFVTTQTLASPPRWLPADAWYATLASATRRSGTFVTARGAHEFDLDASPRALIDGPERRAYLLGDERAQRATLDALAKGLGAPPLPRPDLYLDARALIALRQRRGAIGGHGATHAILTAVSFGDALRELRRCSEDLTRLRLEARVFAYPDGAWSDDLAPLVQALGWRAALTLGDRVATPADAPFALPRFIVPDDPEWVERALLPACT